MKKLNKVLVFMAALFVGVLTANAAISFKEDAKCTASETQPNPQTCQLAFEVTQNKISKGKEITVIYFNPVNIKNNSITITPATGWKVQKLGDTEFKDSLTITLSVDPVYVIYKYNGDADIEVSNNVPYSSIQYDKEDVGLGCGFEFGFPLCKKAEINNQTVYFGLAATPVSEEKFTEDCSCRTLGSGDKKVYYDKEGNVIEGKTNEEAAEIIVNQCYTCEKVEFDGNTYYVGKDGKIKETEKEMLTDCFSCTVPDKDGNYYYEGEKLTDETYKKLCTTPVCEERDGKYYDRDGVEITKEEYDEKCNKCHIEETKDGKLYFNDKNEQITEEEYANQCQPSVPTGASVPYMLIIGGLVAVTTIFFLVKNKSKFKRI